MSDTTESAARPMTLADQAAMIDADSVAARIASNGPRFAIQASTVDIIAMATLIGRLRHVADLTYDMLAFADLVNAQRDRSTKAALRPELLTKIAVTGAALEALGYGQPASTPEESNDGQG